jgi:ABC-type branched-subunit amino acid transport system substrate-binding protein
MVTKVYYEKVGRKYVPVAEYDSDYLDAFPKGSTLVMCYPGGQSRRYNIDPDYAALIAAARVAEDAMIQAMSKASELKPKHTPITEGQRRAWKKLAREFGDELATLNGASSYDIAQAGLEALQQEADKLMTNPAVKEAYDQFLFVCALTKQQEK